VNSRRQSIDTDTLELGDPRNREPQRLAASQHGMVAAQHYLATAAGVEMLRDGGNAIDAAVAAALALGVVEPAASGLGGQTMMLIHTAEPRRTFALDGSSRAPNRANPDVFRGKTSRLRGYCATTVPSTPAVLSYALRRYGKLKWSRVLEPAIRYASEGYPVSPLQHSLAKRELKHFKQSSSATLFLRNGSRPYPVAAIFKQPALAETLQQLARRGSKDFYRGEIAKMIHEDMRANGGLLHLDDLAHIPLPIERNPVSCRFEGLRVITFPPPGAGRTLAEILNILSQFPVSRRDPDTPAGAALLAHVIQQAYFDRRDRPYEPNYYGQVNDTKMLSEDYAKLVAGKIRRRVKRPPKSNGDTTHLSVMDRQGNVVALTQSIERVFGSFEATPELGFLYNNYMSAFEYEDIEHPYYLRPNSMPWASVAPTIVFRGRRPWLAIGSPGSERIASSIMQVMLRLARQTPYDAVAAPRLHCSIDGLVSLEASRMRNDIPPMLLKKGFQVKVRDSYSFYLGCIQLVCRERDTFTGVADPRRDGSAEGPAS
jgi:gamma-glutamyltranspeptidase/glutathione hydrolase